MTTQRRSPASTRQSHVVRASVDRCLFRLLLVILMRTARDVPLMPQGLHRAPRPRFADRFVVRDTTARTQRVPWAGTASATPRRRRRFDDPRVRTLQTAPRRWARASTGRTQGGAFTIPIPYTKVNIHVTDVLASGDDPSVSPGDDLGVDFVLDPSLDVLQPLDTDAGTSSSPPDIGASPGRVGRLPRAWRRADLPPAVAKVPLGGRVERLRLARGCPEQAVGDRRLDRLSGRPIASRGARAVACAQRINVVDWATTTISMDDFLKLVDESGAS